MAVWAAALEESARRGRFTPPCAGEDDVGVLDGMPEIGSDAAMIMLSDPYSFPTDAVLDGIAEAAPGVPVLGGLSSARSPLGDAALFADGRVVSEGAVGVCLNGVELLPCVSQGAAPLGREMTVTAAEDNVIYELAGRPAVQAIEQAVAELALDERALVAAGLLIGIVIDGGKPDYEQGDFLVRGVTGADPETGAITVGAAVTPGEVVRLHARDARSADEDLRRELRLRAAAIGGQRPAGALVFSCNGRGHGMFGTPGPRRQRGPGRAAWRARRRGSSPPERSGPSAGAASCTGSPRRSRCSRAETRRTLDLPAGATLPTLSAGRQHGPAHRRHRRDRRRDRRALGARGVRLLLSGRREAELAQLAEELGGRRSSPTCGRGRRRPARGRRRWTRGWTCWSPTRRIRPPACWPRCRQEEIDRMLDVNLRAPDRPRARVWRRRWSRAGAGTWCSSRRSRASRAQPASSMYSATKFGLRGFGLALREDLRGTGVGVSVVAPGFIRESGMFANTGVKLPPGVGTRTPQDVAAAVIRAIERQPRRDRGGAARAARRHRARVAWPRGPRGWVSTQARARRGSPTEMDAGHRRRAG